MRARVSFIPPLDSVRTAMTDRVHPGASLPRRGAVSGCTALVLVASMLCCAPMAQAENEPASAGVTAPAPLSDSTVSVTVGVDPAKESAQAAVATPSGSFAVAVRSPLPAERAAAPSAPRRPHDNRQASVDSRKVWVFNLPSGPDRRGYARQRTAEEGGRGLSSLEKPGRGRRPTGLARSPTNSLVSPPGPVVLASNENGSRSRHRGAGSSTLQVAAPGVPPDPASGAFGGGASTLLMLAFAAAALPCLLSHRLHAPIEPLRGLGPAPPLERPG